MKNALMAAIMGVLIAGLSPGRAAVVIDFESLQHDGEVVVLQDYAEDGFGITSDADPVLEQDAFGVWGTASPDFNGSTALFSNYDARTVTLESLVGLPFTALSIDLGPLFADPGSGGEVMFTGTRVSGPPVMQTFAFGTDLAPQTFQFAPAFSDLSSLSWRQSDVLGNTPAQFDNIVVQAIPEPGSAVLVIAGLIMLAGLLRCRRADALGRTSGRRFGAGRREVLDEGRATV